MEIIAEQHTCIFRLSNGDVYLVNSNNLTEYRIILAKDTSFVDYVMSLEDAKAVLAIIENSIE